jgi:hypothetical protein
MGLYTDSSDQHTAMLKLIQKSETVVATDLYHIHPIVRINNYTVQAHQSQLKCLLHMSNVVTCFGWNMPSWGNTKHQKFLEVLMQL